MFCFVFSVVVVFFALPLDTKSRGDGDEITACITGESMTMIVYQLPGVRVVVLHWWLEVTMKGSIIVHGEYKQ